MSEIKAPFPWFGGKRRVAHVVWRAFGDVPNYVEPFFGSGAVLLGRPEDGKIETINDRDRYLANFWRAVAADPLDVARHADWPVNEADLHARHRWLVNQTEFRERMHAEPDFFDVKIAGWWVWGLCQWIGAGWCMEPKNHKHPKLDGIGKGIHSNQGHPDASLSNQIPSLNGKSAGMGVHAESVHLLHQKRPEMTHGKGVHAVGNLKQQMPKLSVSDNAAGIGGIHAYSPGRRPSIGNTGQGVHLPAIGNDRGINGVSAPPCSEWFFALQKRLRRVRVACGDWKRVLGPSVLGKGKNVGGRRPCAVFLDPPYTHELRDPYLYTEDDAAISTLVREWALEHGDDPELRIALCGYEGEHEMPSSWAVHSWTAARGYAKADNNNRELERIWFSPHCLPLEANQGSLFGGIA